MCMAYGKRNHHAKACANRAGKAGQRCWKASSSSSNNNTTKYASTARVIKKKFTAPPASILAACPTHAPRRKGKTKARFKLTYKTYISCIQVLFSTTTSLSTPAVVTYVHVCMFFRTTYFYTRFIHTLNMYIFFVNTFNKVSNLYFFLIREFPHTDPSSLRLYNSLCYWYYLSICRASYQLAIHPLIHPSNEYDRILERRHWYFKYLHCLCKNLTPVSMNKVPRNRYINVLS